MLAIRCLLCIEHANAKASCLRCTVARLKLYRNWREIKTAVEHANKFDTTRNTLPCLVFLTDVAWLPLVHDLWIFWFSPLMNETCEKKILFRPHEREVQCRWQQVSWLWWHGLYACYSGKDREQLLGNETQNLNPFQDRIEDWNSSSWRRNGE